MPDTYPFGLRGVGDDEKNPSPPDPAAVTPRFQDPGAQAQDPAIPAAPPNGDASSSGTDGVDASFGSMPASAWSQDAGAATVLARGVPTTLPDQAPAPRPDVPVSEAGADSAIVHVDPSPALVPFPGTGADAPDHRFLSSGLPNQEPASLPDAPVFDAGADAAIPGADLMRAPVRLQDAGADASLLSPSPAAQTDAAAVAAPPVAAAGSRLVTPSGNPYIDGMLSGYAWNSNNLTYSFPTTAGAYSSPNPSGGGEQSFAGFQGVTPQQSFNMQAVFEGTPNTGVMQYGSYESLTGLNFNLVTGADSLVGAADIRVAISSAANPTAYAYYPDGGAGAGDIWFGSSGFSPGGPYASPKPGTYGYQTGLHEAGHTLGLKHPHETGFNGASSFPALPTDMDSLEFTVMSYRPYIGASTTRGYTNELNGYPQTPMMLDIQALQYMYGANYNTNSGDTTYKWDPGTGEMFINGAGQGQPGGNRVFLTIWDGGGRDTYDMSNYTNGSSIDLTPGKWSITSQNQLANLDAVDPTPIFARGNVFNALLYQGDTRSLIEDAIGGSGNDTILGNQAGNNLVGNDGADSLSGVAGNDTLVGGNNNDWLDGGDDNDLELGDAGNDTILGGNGNDTIQGAAGTDSIDAGAGNDLGFWSTGGGNDTMLGGTGTDTLNLQGWTGPTNISTDSITNTVYGAWTVSGTAADRIFSNGAAVIHASSWESIMCFAAGTRIATARGEARVESLCLGELVVTGGRGASLQPILWLGRMRVDVARHPDRAAVAPVLVKAGALGPGTPHRDLRVSPDHALFLDGHLVPARLLVNGTTILQELWCPTVVYWHVELPAHALLLSEGALTEDPKATIQAASSNVTV